jgi:NADH:ubiquinone oxidoreductase subunit 2 (subunit N)
VIGIFSKKRRNVVNSLSVASICSILLLISCAWEVVKNMNVDRCGGLRMIDYVSNIISSFILVIQLIVMNQVVRAWERDTGQVGRHFPHLMFD